MSASKMSENNQLAERFRRVTGQQNQEEEIEVINQMNFTDLAKEKIAFGTAKLGQPFTEVIEDRRYVSWFVSNYQNSRKASHAKFIRFVQLYVEKQEMKPKTKAMASPYRKGEARPTSAEEIPIEQPSESEMWEQISQPPRRSAIQAEMNDMQSRLLQIEDMMQQVLQHLSPPKA